MYIYYINIYIDREQGFELDYGKDGENNMENWVDSDGSKHQEPTNKVCSCLII